MSGQEKLDAANRLTYPPSEPRATIEVQLARNINGEVVIGGKDSCSRVYPHHNVKPLNPAAEAILNPKNEVEEIAKRLNATLWHGDETQWEHISSEYRETWYGVAREVCRMKVEELNVLRELGIFSDALRERFDKRIAELEEMAKGPS